MIRATKAGVRDWPVGGSVWDRPVGGSVWDRPVGGSVWHWSAGSIAVLCCTFSRTSPGCALHMWFAGRYVSEHSPMSTLRD